MDTYVEGIRAYNKGDLALAEQHFIQVLERVPRDAQIWFRLGNIYAQTNRPRLAVSAYQNALIRDPDLAKAWHNLGVVHLRQAVNDFVSLANTVPSDDPLHSRGQKMSQAIIALIDELPENNEVEVDLDLNLGIGSSDPGDPPGEQNEDAPSDAE